MSIGIVQIRVLLKSMGKNQNIRRFFFFFFLVNIRRIIWVLLSSNFVIGSWPVGYIYIRSTRHVQRIQMEVKRTRWRGQIKFHPSQQYFYCGIRQQWHCHHVLWVSWEKTAVWFSYLQWFSGQFRFWFLKGMHLIKFHLCKDIAQSLSQAHLYRDHKYM